MAIGIVGLPLVAALRPLAASSVLQRSAIGASSAGSHSSSSSLARSSGSSRTSIGSTSSQRHSACGLLKRSIPTSQIDLKTAHLQG